MIRRSTGTYFPDPSPDSLTLFIRLFFEFPAMRDPLLARLLSALDAVPSATTAVLPVEAGDDFALSSQRLQVAARYLGGSVQSSPYLTFARRLVAQPEAALAVAVSA